MGGGDNEITIKTILDPSGFVKGSKQLQAAVKGLGNAAKSVGSSAKNSFNGLLGTARRLAPMIIGVGSAFQVISKAVHAFMAENQELSTKMSSIWSTLGNILGPIITQVINWVSTAISLFIQFLGLLGITVKQSKNAAKAAGGAASELKKTIAGFDELNTLSDNSGGGGGGAGNTGLDPKDMPDWLKALADALKNKLWDDAADIIIGKFNELVNLFKNKAYEFGKKAGEYFAAAVHMIARFIKEADWKGIGQAIADFIDGLFEDVDPVELGTILVGKFIIAFKMLAGFLENLDWGQLAKVISGIIVGALSGISDAILSADFRKIGQNIRLFFTKIDWAGIRDTFKTLLKTAVQAAIDFLWGLLKLPGDPPNFWKNLSVEKIAKSLLVIVKQAVKDAVSLLWDVVGFPDTPENFWKNIKENSLRDTFSKKISTAVQGAIDGLWEAINLPGEPPNIIEYISSITGNITTLASEITTFVSDVFNGKFKPVLDYGEKSALATIIEEIVSVISKLSDTATTVLTGVWNDIIRPFLEPSDVGEKSGLQQLLEGIAEIIGTIADTINENWDNIVAIYDKWLAPMARLTFDVLIETIHELADFFGNLTSWLAGKKSFAEFWGDLSPVQEKVAAIAVSIGTFAAVFEGGILVSNIASVIDKLSGGGGLAGAIETVAGKSDTLKAGLTALFSPAGAVMTGLSLIITYVGWVDSENKKFAQTLGDEAEAVDGLSGAVGAYGDAIRNNLVDAMNQMIYATGDGAVTLGMVSMEYDILHEKIDQFVQDLANGNASMEESEEVYEELGQTIDQLRQYEAELEAQGYKHQEVTDMINKLEQERAKILEAQETAISKTADAITTEAKATEAATKNVEALNQSQEEANRTTEEAGQGYENLGVEVEEGTTKVESEVSDMGTEVKGTLDTMDSDFTGSAEDIKGTMQNFSDDLVTIVSNATDNMRTDFQVGMTEFGNVASAATQDMNNVLAWNFSIIAQNAYWWGVDIIASLNNGIKSVVRQFEGNIAMIAAMIRAYLGFSEPEKGPLSNFHTFMPDMMKLLSKGIEDNIPLAKKAADDVAETIADEISDEDYKIGKIESDQIEGSLDGFSEKIIDGFSKLIDSLQAIAESVTFAMPDVAAGSVLPYGVDGAWGMSQNGQENSEMLGAIQDLREIITGFQESVENMQFIAQFGDLRAVAERITTIQKQLERAKG